MRKKSTPENEKECYKRNRYDLKERKKKSWNEKESIQGADVIMSSLRSNILQREHAQEQREQLWDNITECFDILMQERPTAFSNVFEIL